MERVEAKLDRVIGSNSALPSAQHEMYCDIIKALRDVMQGAYSVERLKTRVHDSLVKEMTKE